ncbi:MAG: hypothetical protein EP330_24845 [Deltaproteobacteria bacterium]|nr:MAG: hypothetical protein EP330_24845 [Deltaproteobacteria bacterium]
MDKRIPLIGGASLFAIVLAVLVIGRPDTGGDVVEREILTDKPMVATGGSEEVVRIGAGPSAPVADGNVAVAGEGDTIGGASDPSLNTFVPLQTLGQKPKKSALLGKRNNAESTWAAHSLAPWTEVKRQLNTLNAPEELIGEVDGMIGEVRSLRLDGESINFDELAAQQAELEARVRETPYMNTVMEQMFDKLAENQAKYANGEFEPSDSKGKTLP